MERTISKTTKYRKDADKKYNTCITSSIHHFIYEIFQYNEGYEMAFVKNNTEQGMRNFAFTLADEYISSHKEYRIIKNGKKSEYEPMIFEIVFSKLNKTREKYILDKVT